MYNNLNDVLYTNPKSKRIFEPISRRSKIDKAALLDKQMSVINYLGLAITRDALTQYYNAMIMQMKYIQELILFLKM